MSCPPKRQQKKKKKKKAIFFFFYNLLFLFSSAATVMSAIIDHRNFNDSTKPVFVVVVAFTFYTTYQHNCARIQELTDTHLRHTSLSFAANQWLPVRAGSAGSAWHVLAKSQTTLPAAITNHIHLNDNHSITNVGSRYRRRYPTAFIS